MSRYIYAPHYSNAKSDNRCFVKKSINNSFIKNRFDHISVNLGTNQNNLKNAYPYFVLIYKVIIKKIGANHFF